MNPDFQKQIQIVIQNTLKEYNQFFDLSLTEKDFSITFLKKREEMDIIVWRQTRNWVRANTSSNNEILIFDIEYLEEATQGNHKKDEDEYLKCIRHELSHVFYNYFLKDAPLRSHLLWFNEWLAVYLSWQIQKRKKPDKFVNVLSCRSGMNSWLYAESWFILQYVVETFGRDVFIQFLTEIKKIQNHAEFLEVFEKTYLFPLTYEEINKRI